MTKITREEIENRIAYDQGEFDYYLKEGEHIEARSYEIRLAAMKAQLRHDDEIAAARRDEAERCALLNEALAIIHEHSAGLVREKGGYETRALWPISEFGKKVKFVMPGHERAARVMEAAARSLRVVAQCIRTGYDTRDIKPKADERIDA